MDSVLSLKKIVPVLIDSYYNLSLCKKKLAGPFKAKFVINGDVLQKLMTKSIFFDKSVFLMMVDICAKFWIHTYHIRSTLLYIVSLFLEEEVSDIVFMYVAFLREQ